MRKPLVGISMMHETEFLKAVYPLFQEQKIEVIEWSFDMILKEEYKPEWLHLLLSEYSSHNRLLGHGVRFSIFDAKWTNRQEHWLDILSKEVKKYNYTHITEHFGFMSSEHFHKGCPLPVSLSDTTLQIGIDRLLRIQETASLPVGIENLAFAFNKKEVQEQGDFLRQLIEPINGFIILDLHNIYCQAMNFNIDIMELVELYPLDKVKEIHISGGSWQESIYTENKRIRRDTHDEAVPQGIFEVLSQVLHKCPFCECILIERLGDTLYTPSDISQYYDDYEQLQGIIKESTAEFKKGNWGNKAKPFISPIEDEVLYEEQKLLSQTLLEISDCKDLKNKLKLKNWKVEEWDLAMIDTAMIVNRKWS